MRIPELVREIAEARGLHVSGVPIVTSRSTTCTVTRDGTWFCFIGVSQCEFSGPDTLAVLISRRVDLACRTLCEACTNAD